MREQVAKLLQSLFDWSIDKSVRFVADVLAEHECERILEHVRASPKFPHAAVAAVIYKARLRVARGDAGATRLAETEATSLQATFPHNTALHTENRRKKNWQRTPPKEYHAASRGYGARRREHDSH